MTGRLLTLGGIFLAVTAFAGDDFEPDDTFETARPVGDGIREFGRSLDPENDEDWYSLELDAPGTIIAEALHRTGNDGHASVTIRSGPLAAFKASGEDSIALDVEAGIHFVRFANQNSEMIFNYDVSIFVYPMVEDESEPNDVLINATPLPPKTFLRNRSLLSDDQDWFSVDVGAEPRPVVLQTMSPLRIAKIKVFDGNGSDANFGIGNRYFVDTLDAGPHAFLLEQFSDQRVVPSYDVVFWFRDEPDPYEDDDAPTRASRVPAQGAGHSNVARAQLHSLHDANDVDWVRFYIDEDVDNFTVRAPRIIGDDPFIEIWDSSATQQFAGPGQASQSMTSMGAGDYLARFYANGTPQPNGVYEVSVDTIPMPRFTQGSVVGSVIRSAKGTLISGARVEMTGGVNANRTTDALGIFAFEALPQGNYSLQAFAEGFVTDSRSIQVGSAVSTESFTLDPIVETDVNDLNGDSSVNSLDIQLMINAVLGLGGNPDPNNDGNTNSIDIQIIINAVLGV